MKTIMLSQFWNSEKYQKKYLYNEIGNLVCHKVIDIDNTIILHLSTTKKRTIIVIK